MGHLDEQHRQQHQQQSGDARDARPADDARTDESRPDLVGPRGNPEVEQQDLDRGRERFDQVLGW